jgi:hypothetical protein
MPVSAKGYLVNLAIASIQVSQSVPSTVTLYVNGTPSQLSCTVSYSAPNCTDKVHKVPVDPSETFTVLATCAATNTENCAQGLQVAIDRLQLVTQ